MINELIHKSDKEFLVESFDEIDFNKIVEVLDGKRLGVIFKRVIPQSTCQTISNEFWDHPELYVRESDAPAHYLGSFHFGKELDEYMSECSRFRDKLDTIFRGIEDPVNSLMFGLKTLLSNDGRVIRSATWNGMSAGKFVMRAWLNQEEYSLAPHEDFAQCRVEKQRGFEIQDIPNDSAIGAFNICINNSKGGNLKIWDYIPSDEDRVYFGTTETGSPYPPEALLDFPNLSINIEAGDVYIFDGRYVHAVTNHSQVYVAGENLMQPARTTISFLLSNIDSKTTITWT